MPWQPAVLSLLLCCSLSGVRGSQPARLSPILLIPGDGGETEVSGGAPLTVQWQVTSWRRGGSPPPRGRTDQYLAQGDIWAQFGQILGIRSPIWPGAIQARIAGYLYRICTQWVQIEYYSQKLSTIHGNMLWIILKTAQIPSIFLHNNNNKKVFNPTSKSMKFFYWVYLFKTVETNHWWLTRAASI